eukprot:jgi/Ulvmu1/10276/UM060_0078.1
MLHVIQLLGAPIYVLRSMYTIPLTIGIILACLHQLIESRQVIAVVCVGYTFILGALTAAVSAWMRFKWPLREDIERQVWSAQTDLAHPRCCFSGEQVTHKCPRCSALINQCCMFEELTHVIVPILKGTDRMKFLNALDKSLPGMAARMFLDEALELQADWMQVRASMCCLACTADIRCFQIMPVLATAIACFAVAAAAVPCALRALPAGPAPLALPTAAVLLAATSATAAPAMLASAFCTMAVFTDLHRNVPWSEAALVKPTAFMRLLAGPSYLTELPLYEEEDEDEDEPGVPRN